MLVAVVVFGLLGQALAEEPCPKFCNCSRPGFNAAIVRCSLLDPDQQRFPPEVGHVIADVNYISLHDNFFAKLGLEHVISLKLTNVGGLSLDTFKGLKSLSDLDLVNNSLSSLPQDIFKNNIELRRLRLAHNPLVIPRDHYFLDSAYISELDLSYCSIEHLNPRTFTMLKNVETIILKGNKIQRLNPDAFQGLDDPVEIDLSDNLLERIDPVTFSNLEGLTVLSLSGNPLLTIEGLEASELSELDLSRCRLTRIGSSDLEGFPHVESLNLSSNYIKSLAPDSLSSLIHLTHLDLSHNKLRGPLPQLLFEEVTALETLILSGNPDLQSANIGTSLLSLHRYDVASCGLEVVTSADLAKAPHLATLNMSGNALARLDPDVFNSLSKLTVLDISHNKLRFLPSKLFSSNPNLGKLLMSGNQFHHLGGAVFRYTPKLYWLDISDCKISSLWNSTEAEGVLGDLVHLNIAGNRLHRLHLHHFIGLKKLVRLDISRNPLECSRSFGHLLEWLMLQRVRPNGVLASRPIGMSEEVRNNILWDETLQRVCPYMHPTRIEEQQNSIVSVEEALPLGQQPTVAPLPSPTSQRYVIAVVIVVALAVVVVVGNAVAVAISRARRNYRLVAYRSEFANPLGGLAQVRRGGTPLYHKLYEDCSVANTPIVKGKGIVTCLPSSGGRPSLV